MGVLIGSVTFLEFHTEPRRDSRGLVTPKHLVARTADRLADGIPAEGKRHRCHDLSVRRDGPSDDPMDPCDDQDGSRDRRRRSLDCVQKWLRDERALDASRRHRARVRYRSQAC
jgi:hypothetical protein